MPDQYVIIVAGGSGSRMKSEIPKQFLAIANKPVLMHTLEAFYNYSPSINIILALPDLQIAYWNELCNTYHFNVPHKVTKGGNTRFESVKNGLQLVPVNTIVAIHDGVRPLVSRSIIEASFNTASSEGNAIASVALKDSIRKVENGESHAVDRNFYRIVQTPQAFKSELIKKAYATEEKSTFTDCASVAEASGIKIVLIEGAYENIKITTPEDLEIAKVLLKNKKL